LKGELIYGFYPIKQIKFVVEIFGEEKIVIEIYKIFISNIFLKKASN
jgi:hypothetical protein